MENNTNLIKNILRIPIDLNDSSPEEAAHKICSAINLEIKELNGSKKEVELGFNIFFIKTSDLMIMMNFFLDSNQSVTYLSLMLYPIVLKQKTKDSKDVFFSLEIENNQINVSDLIDLYKSAKRKPLALAMGMLFWNSLFKNNTLSFILIILPNKIIITVLKIIHS